MIADWRDVFVYHRANPVTVAEAGCENVEIVGLGVIVLDRGSGIRELPPMAEVDVIPSPIPERVVTLPQARVLVPAAMRWIAR